MTNERNYNTISGRLTSLREFMKLTQEEFAEELGVSASSISSMERGTSVVSDTVMASLVNKYGVTLRWLNSGEGDTFDDRTRVNEVMGLYARLDEKGREEIYNQLSHIGNHNRVVDQSYGRVNK